MTIQEFYELQDSGEIKTKHLNFDDGYGACEAFKQNNRFFLAIFHAIDAVSIKRGKKIVIPHGWMKTKVYEFDSAAAANEFYKKYVAGEIREGI